MVVALGIVVVLVVSGVDSLARSFADWRVSANAVAVAQSQVEIAQINADTAVKVAEINADTTKKTDATFILFYMVRYLLWTTPVLLVVLVGALVWRAQS